MRLAWKPILLLAILGMLQGCAEYSAPHGDPRLRSGPLTHSVQAGETLYSISWNYGHDYRLVAAWNGISTPYTIHPGQRIRLHPPPGFQPPRQVAQTSTSQAPAPRNAPERATPPPRTATTPAPRTPPTPDRRPAPAAPGPTTTAPVTWRWPAEGRAARVQGTRQSQRLGVEIAGEMGQPVFAAGSGRVVYAGSGLIGYGRLIIIKHDDTYLSAYAHNRELLVKEGDRVTVGQQIAEMGNTGRTDRVMLYFEIRQDGKPVDPFGFLPKRES